MGKDDVVEYQREKKTIPNPGAFICTRSRPCSLVCRMSNLSWHRKAMPDLQVKWGRSWGGTVNIMGSMVDIYIYIELTLTNHITWICPDI